MESLTPAARASASAVRPLATRKVRRFVFIKVKWYLNWRTECHQNCPARLSPGFETGTQFTLRTQIGSASRFEKTNPTAGQLLSGCRGVSGAARNLRYEAKSGQRPDLKKRTQRWAACAFGLSPGFETGTQFTIRSQIGPASRFEKTNPTAGHVLSGCRRVSRAGTQFTIRSQIGPAS